MLLIFKINAVNLILHVKVHLALVRMELISRRIMKSYVQNKTVQIFKILVVCQKPAVLVIHVVNIVD